MKKHPLLTIVLLVVVFNSEAQNLVPNSDFEQYSPCPPSAGYLNYATSWFNPADLTPDYFNVCAGSNGAGVPGNAFGNQLPHSGDGYAGIYGFQSPYLDVREYACAQLTQPLTAGTTYLVQYYLNLSGMSQYAVITYGAYFAATASVTLNGYLINAVPQIENTSLLTDTTGWMLIIGTFVAAGGEQYIIIGSFKDDLNCGLQQVYPGAVAALSYYYIDDVSVTSLTSMEEQNQADDIKIYPNPARDELRIKNASPIAIGVKIKAIKIFNILGEQVLQSAINNMESEIKIDVSKLNSAIYFLEINDGKNIFRKKFLKE